MKIQVISGNRAIYRDVEQFYEFDTQTSQPKPKITINNGMEFELDIMAVSLDYISDGFEMKTGNYDVDAVFMNFTRKQQPELVLCPFKINSYSES